MKDCFASEIEYTAVDRQCVKKEFETQETVIPNRKKGHCFCKRIFDIFFSIAGLIIFSPVHLLIAIAIFIDDPGPVLFFQERNGLNGKAFTIWKFRTMFQDAPEFRDELEPQNELDGPVFKIKDDPRITRVGRLLRRTSLDELPQLVNILRGEMSFVGPRPLPTYETERLNTYQRQRMLIKPGLTCYWQCSGRHKIPFQQWMELDLKYINEECMWNDIKILYKTFFSVISGEGAC